VLTSWQKNARSRPSRDLRQHDDRCVIAMKWCPIWHVDLSRQKRAQIDCDLTRADKVTELWRNEFGDGDVE